METKKGTKYPLFITYKDIPIASNGFSARVSIKAKVLLEHRDDEFAMYGVNPGGIAGSGKSVEEAHKVFNERLVSVLLDIAEESDDFNVLRDEVLEFVRCTNDSFAELWTKGVEQVRSSKINLDLPRASAEYGFSVAVSPMNSPKPADNERIRSMVSEREIAA